MDIIGKKILYFIFSGLVIVPGVVSLILWGLKPSIDFTGGTLLEIKFEKKLERISVEDIKKILSEKHIETVSIQTSHEESFIIRTKPMNKEISKEFQDTLRMKYGALSEVRSETVGPIIGKETTENAFKSILISSCAIILYIAWAFRKIPKPYSSFMFGICAVLALIHDVFVLVGVFSLLGHFFHVEIDSLFITAVLTVMGFSVHDTIVVFDRIRENLRKMPDKNFSFVVNESMVQTLTRSLSTSLTVLFTLFALFLFGGETIRYFIIALLIGITSGTYSSIFNASPLLVVWEEWRQRKKIELRK